MLEVFRVELRRSFIEFVRYPLESLGGIVITTSIFYSLFLSAQYIAGPTARQFGERIDAILVGYILWDLVVFITSDIAGGLQKEAQTGTLEQLFLSPFGAPRIFLIRAAAELTVHLILMVCILLVIMALTGSQLSFPPILFLPLGTVLLGAYGIAFIMGSIALLFKRISRLVGMFQFVLLFLMTAPTETWTGSLSLARWLLPMTAGAGLLRDLMARGKTLDLRELSLALLSGIGYFAIGLLIFRFLERQAKKQGMLGGY
ncbi:MAG TPA: ABC transporter [Cyanobacteria bacterium UBA8553]|nr:ABC transporter [Cyanobacteria bacterium UBA8553]HAJ63097.1 ABC transporter [Cyanobacteria bacterium UBA8543]